MAVSSLNKRQLTALSARPRREVLTHINQRSDAFGTRNPSHVDDALCARASRCRPCARDDLFLRPRSSVPMRSRTARGSSHVGCCRRAASP